MVLTCGGRAWHVGQAGLFKTTSETVNNILKSKGVGGFYVGYFTTVSCPSPQTPTPLPPPLSLARARGRVGTALLSIACRCLVGTALLPEHRGRPCLCPGPPGHALRSLGRPCSPPLSERGRRRMRLAQATESPASDSQTARLPDHRAALQQPGQATAQQRPHCRPTALGCPSCSYRLPKT